MSFTAFFFICLGACLLSVAILRLCSLLYVKFHHNKPIPVAKFVNGSRGLLERSHPVRYCSEPTFQRVLRFVPWEAIGVLIISDGTFIFRGVGAKDEEVTLELNKNDSRIQYLEPSFIRDGGLSWFVIEFDGERHFFASEDGLPEFETPLTTTGVYEAVTDVYFNE